jgi:hypothetical protein
MILNGGRRAYMLGVLCLCALLVLANGGSANDG